MPSQAWKAEERRAATLIGGRRYPGNSGGRVDAESCDAVCQVKHRRVLSLAALEALAVEQEQLGAQRGKAGVVIVKRRAGKGRQTPRLVVMTEAVWKKIHTRKEDSTCLSTASQQRCGPTTQPVVLNGLVPSQAVTGKSRSTAAIAQLTASSTS